MTHEFELGLGDEIRGVVCPTCGGSVAWKRGRAWCYEDGFVEPVPERPVSYRVLDDEAMQWLRDNDMMEEENGN